MGVKMDVEANNGARKLIGAYAAAMGGVDAIIFTAGVGENGALSVWISPPAWVHGREDGRRGNNVRGKEAVISAADSKVSSADPHQQGAHEVAMDTAAIVK